MLVLIRRQCACVDAKNEVPHFSEVMRSFSDKPYRQTFTHLIEIIRFRANELNLRGKQLESE